jgi:ABC-type glycerol-3-phosphate transport system substrate-binding protein
VIDTRGYVRLYSPENMMAYNALLETIKCAPSNAMDFYVQDGLKQLMDGKIAMCIAFTNTASILVTHASGFLSHNIGFAPIPKHKSVVSGWNICINSRSKNIEQAWDFIQWFSSMEIASAYTILGGSAPMNAILEQESLAQLFPWNAMASREYPQALHRDVPVLPGTKALDQVAVENLLAGVVTDHLKHQIPLDETLLKAHRALCCYAEENGYPKNAPPVPI